MTVNRKALPLQKHLEKDEARRLTDLFARATSSSSNREKNLLIDDVQAMFMRQEQLFADALAQNSLKKLEQLFADVLSSLQKALSDLRSQRRAVRETHGVFELLCSHCSELDRDTMVSSIQRIESDLALHGAPESNRDLESGLARADISGDEQTAMLRDVHMQRLEELIHVLQRRLIHVEQNQELTREISSEFGSVLGLVDALHALSDENERLRKGETDFYGDPLVRRLQDRMSVHAVRPLVLALQSDLESEAAQRRALEWALPAVACAGRDIDALVPDANFTVATAENMGGDAELLRAQAERLESDLVGLRVFAFPGSPDDGRRMLAYADANPQLLGQYEAL
jgi:hypothetical protein